MRDFVNLLAYLYCEPLVLIHLVQQNLVQSCHSRCSAVVSSLRVVAGFQLFFLLVQLLDHLCQAFLHKHKFLLMQDRH